MSFKPCAIDLFAGAGGFTTGLTWAGIRVMAAIESDRRAAATYRHNHPRVTLIEEDIRRVAVESFQRRRGIRSELSAIVAGAPCQGFSESNRRSRTLENEANNLYRRFLTFVRALKPKVFVFENVLGIKTVEGGVVVRRIVRAGRAAGYKLRTFELNAADFGVPQLRRRVFIVGSRTGIAPQQPCATHGVHPAYVSVAAAIMDLPGLRNGAHTDLLMYRSGTRLTAYQKLMRSTTRKRKVSGNLVTFNSPAVRRRYGYIREGENWRAIPSRLMRNYANRRRCHTGIYHRLSAAAPAKVLGNFRKNMLIHPTQNRGLSVREAARLQSFPDHYRFLGSIGFQQQQVGNAVPPLVAYAIGNEIRRLLGLRRCKLAM